MRTSSRFVVLPAALTILAMLVGCTGPGASVAPSEEESAAGSMAASTEPDECTAENLETKQEGVLTIGTDNPAFPPYFQPDDDTPDPWELGDPTNGEGFESAVAYAVAEELGFSDDQVEWIPVPFDNSFAPGPKEFDYYLAQVSYTPERAEAVDMSDGYYFVNQALVARQNSPIAGVSSVDEVAQYRLGVAQGTTSLQYIEEVIQPEQEPRVYNDNTGAINGIRAEQVDGIVVDLPTAFFITAVQFTNGVIVGQFPSQGADEEQEHFSLVLEQDSPLTDCVNQALAALTDNGELEQITDDWLSEAAGAPVLE
ncbi:MAG TPA: ABC transporter substrate-binding protein [Candidatus Limnocylindria bacterium]|nr:ABC transporter substrate-binding protein [Candidatus Limnocylindria bacterium]